MSQEIHWIQCYRKHFAISFVTSENTRDIFASAFMSLLDLYCKSNFKWILFQRFLAFKLMQWLLIIPYLFLNMCMYHFVISSIIQVQLKYIFVIMYFELIIFSSYAEKHMNTWQQVQLHHSCTANNDALYKMVKVCVLKKTHCISNISIHFFVISAITKQKCLEIYWRM